MLGHFWYLLRPASVELEYVEGELDLLGGVLAEAAVHLAPRARVEDHLLDLLPDVHLHVGGALAEAVP